MFSLLFVGLEQLLLQFIKIQLPLMMTIRNSQTCQSESCTPCTRLQLDLKGIKKIMQSLASGQPTG